MSEAQAKWLPDWPVRSLEEIASKITSGGTPLSGSPRYYVESGGLPFAKTEDLTRARSKYIERCELEISEAALRETAAKRYQAGTIFVSMYGTIGLTKIAARGMAANQALCALIPPLACNSDYLYHYLDFIRPEWLKYSGQTTQANIKAATVRACKVPLPDRVEQRHIADILDTLDTAIEHTGAIIAKLNAVKQGLLHDLLARGIGANGELRPPQSEAPHLYKESPLGWIPKSWDYLALSRRLRRLTYGFTNPMPTTDDGPWMITAADINHGIVQYARARRTSFRAYRLLSAKSRPEIGDVLVTKDGTLGRIAVVDEAGMCVNQSVAVLSPLNIADSTYIATFLQSSRGQNLMLADAGGSTIKHLYITNLARMAIPWPSEGEATQILHRISAITDRVNSEQQQLLKLRAEKAGLMDDLLTGRVRVTPLLARSHV